MTSVLPPSSRPPGDELGPDPKDPALRRRNLRTAAWVVGLMVVMFLASYFGRNLMVPVLFKT